MRSVLRVKRGLLSVVLVSCLLLHSSQVLAAMEKQAAGAGQGQQINVLIEAMRMGDTATVARILDESKDPVVHVWSAMIFERQRFNLAKSSEDARVCEASLATLQPQIAMACGRFEVANLLLAGRTAEARQRLDALKTKYAALDNAALKGLSDQAQAIEATAASPSVLPDTDFEIPTQRDISTPVVDALVNGHHVKIVVDTGAQGLVLGRGEAARLHVKSAHRNSTVSGWLAEGISTQSGVADRLNVGPIEWHDVPVTVVPGDVNLLGLDMLSPLPAVRITRKSILVYGTGSVRPACTEAMATSSRFDGTEVRLVPTIAVDGKKQPVLLDTGSSQYLLGSGAALAQVETLRQRDGMLADVGGAHVFAKAPDAKVNVVIAGQPIDVHFSVLSDSKTPWPFTLGAAALQDMDFFMDFRNQRACFLLHDTLR